MNGDKVSFCLDYGEDNSNINPVDINLRIIYEDDSLLLVDKPPFMPIHPTAYHQNDTLANGVKYYYDKIGLNKKIRPVNRLDRNTSGLVLLAKNEYIQELLIRQMATGSFRKKYLGLVHGNLEDLLIDSYVKEICYNKNSFISSKYNTLGKIEGIISAPISRKENSIIERKINKNGLSSKTNFKVIENYSDYSLLEFALETGRTHQIRVHTKFIGHPLLGDSLYGDSSTLISRQALHSYFISFIHPITGSFFEFTSELPEDMQNVINNLKNSNA